MASHYKENILHGRDHTDTHASDNRWRHQESTAFARHAALSSAPKKVREADSHGGVSDLADFLNKSRIDAPDAGASSRTHKPILINTDNKAGVASKSYGPEVGVENAGGISLDGQGEVGDTKGTDGREIRCGPLINYRRMEGSTWHGSVLIVTRGGIQEQPFEPKLKLKRAYEKVSNHVAGPEYVLPSGNAGGVEDTESRGEITVKGVKLYADPENVFWRFHIRVEMEEAETHWEYEIPGLRFPPAMKKRDKQSFFVPAVNQSMRVMFHSCNGFSVGTDEAAWSGPALWNDVIRVHKETPFHVM